MPHRVAIAAIVCALLAAPAAVHAADPGVTDPPEGFTALFNGKNLDGWWGAGTEDPRGYLALPADQLAAKKQKSLEDVNKHWSVENGVLVNDGHGLYLTTDKNYGDFELLVEYRTVPKADSGIYLRGVPQVQIWDYTEEAKFNIGADKGSGGLWNNPAGDPGKDPLVRADKPFGEWNKFRIVMIGEYVTVYLNGKLVVDRARMNNYFDNKKPAGEKRPVLREGPIQLQTHGGEIRWRNVFIREIGAEEANDALREIAEKDGGFKTLFNGSSLDGWKGATDNYEVVDGAIQCKAGKGGSLYTADEYADFTATLEFQVPPGGNNGLAIRYPGSGDPAYAGMCELQVLDNTAEKYAKLDPRQYHGSVYGQVAAKRGFLRPVGEWNFQRVTVNGSHIIVELNGFVIVDADINDVTEFMAPKEKFAGRDRKAGHFGFAGHGDPVRFRGVKIKSHN